MTEGRYVGQRLSYDGQLCTLRYIGPVKGTTGQWLGVEWDDAQRGKHDGTHDGVKYFACSSRQSTAASFVRPSRRTDTPVDFIEAVKQKYASELTNGVYNVRFDQSEDTIKISGKEVEEVGFDKIRKQLANLKQLRIIVADTLRVCRPLAKDASSELRSKSDVAEAIPNVTELDVSRNLFECWSEITDICRQLTRLTSLRVDGNKFNGLEFGLDQQQLAAAPFSRIKFLSLSDTLLRWKEVARIARILPSLATLAADGNEYTYLTSDELPASIENLSLERNHFKSLEAVGPATRLDHLQTLSLRENPICGVSNREDTGASTDQFTFPKSLVELNLPYCSINDWSVIDTLNRLFPGLTSLRVSHNPLYETLTSAEGKPLTADDGYMLTMARISNLNRLNFSFITPKERLNAELYYLSQMKQELSLAPPASASTIIGRHPRYHELCRQYGQPGDTRTTIPSVVDTRTLAASLVSVTFKLHADLIREAADADGRDSAHLSVRRWHCELPKSYSIYKVIGLIAKHYSLRPMSLQLELESVDDDTFPGEAESDLSSDTSDDETGPGRKTRQMQLVQNELTRQILTPLVRALDTWVEGNEATIWVHAKSGIS